MDYDYDQLVEAFEYLDALRESGITNMFGADRFVSRDLGHDKKTTSYLVSSWMKTFDDQLSSSDRAKSLQP